MKMEVEMVIQGILMQLLAARRMLRVRKVNRRKVEEMRSVIYTLLQIQWYVYVWMMVKD